MPKYWVIAPAKYEAYNPEPWNAVWKFNKEHKVISIGWNDLGDYSNLSEEKLKQAVAYRWTDYKGGALTNASNMLWNFCHGIEYGDILIVRKGRKIIVDIGIVTKTYFHSPNMNAEAAPDHPHSNYLEVMWQGMEPKEFNHIVFGMQTLYEVTGEQFKQWVTESKVEVTLPIKDEVVLAPVLVPESNAEFVLEKYLEDFIVSNFDAIFQGKLAIYKEDDVKAQQYGTDVGIIDILARDTATQDFVVIELKKGMESDKVIGQTLRYMGWVQENLCGDKFKVRGLIICKDTDTKFSYALKMVPSISPKYYKVNFELRDKGD